MKKREKGFTLIEMMLVVGIIAMLTAIILPRFNTFTATAEATAADAQISAIRTQISAFNIDTGGLFPTAINTAAGWTNAGASVDDTTYWPDGLPALPTGWTYDSTTGLLSD